MDLFTFEDMKLIKRGQLGNEVPLELFRTIRLIGMYQGLPLGGKGTTVTVGRKIGENLPVRTIEELLDLLVELRIGLPTIVSKDERMIRIAVDDCFCSGLPVHESQMVCDLEGAIMEGAISRMMSCKVTVKEVKCNVNGDERCEYEVRLM